MNVPYLQHRYGGKTPPRSGLIHPTIAPYGAFDCGDGKGVLLSIQNEREWVNLCAKVLKQPELATDERFGSNKAGSPTGPRWKRSPEVSLARRPRRHGREAGRAKIAYGRLSTIEDVKQPH